MYVDYQQANSDKSVESMRAGQELYAQSDADFADYEDEENADEQQSRRQRSASQSPIDDVLSQLDSDLDSAIASQNYEAAAELRDRRQLISQNLSQLSNMSIDDFMDQIDEIQFKSKQKRSNQQRVQQLEKKLSQLSRGQTQELAQLQAALKVTRSELENERKVHAAEHEQQDNFEAEKQAEEQQMQQQLAMLQRKQQQLQQRQKNSQQQQRAAERPGDRQAALRRRIPIDAQRDAERRQNRPPPPPRNTQPQGQAAERPAVQAQQRNPMPTKPAAAQADVPASKLNSAPTDSINQELEQLQQTDPTPAHETPPIDEQLKSAPHLKQSQQLDQQKTDKLQAEAEQLDNHDVWNWRMNHKKDWSLDKLNFQNQPFQQQTHQPVSTFLFSISTCQRNCQSMLHITFLIHFTFDTFLHATSEHMAESQRSWGLLKTSSDSQQMWFVFENHIDI